MSATKLPVAPESLGQAPGRGRLRGRRILVVGGGQRVVDAATDPVGNGRAISVLFAREGAHLVVADKDMNAALATVELIAGEGAKAYAVGADIADPADITAMVETVQTELGGLDGLVLNVGIAGAQGLEGASPEDWDMVLKVNLRGPMLCCRAAFPTLDDNASIVFVASAAALMAGSRMPAYDSSKAGLLGLMRHAALEGAPRGIRANAVAPGLMDTPLGRFAAQGRPSRAATAIPLGREGTGWESAYAALFLMSGEAAYVTGQCLAVDGGLTGVA